MRCDCPGLTTPALDRDWGRCYDELSPHTRLFGRVYILAAALGQWFMDEAIGED